MPEAVQPQMLLLHLPSRPRRPALTPCSSPSLVSSPAEVLEQERQGGLGQRAQDGGEPDVHRHPGSERQHHLLRVSEGVQHGGIGAAQRHRQRHHQKATQVSAQPAAVGGALAPDPDLVSPGPR